MEHKDKVLRSHVMTTCCLLSTLSILLICFLGLGIADPFKHRAAVFNRINPNLLIYNPQHDPLNNNTALQMSVEDPITTIHTVSALNKSGHGIVYTGNSDLFGLIYVSISMLNHLNFTQYPIEIFINGVASKQIEDLSRCKSLFTDHFASSLDISCIFINDNIENIDTRFSYKLVALSRSRFQHILFLDADNVIIQSPSVLFQSAEYLRNGAIFWPDLWGKECAYRFEGGFILYASCIEGSSAWNGINEHNGRTPMEYDLDDLRFTQSQESAQLVVDTVTHYETLQAVLECTESNEYQQYLHGDKDCFRIMFLQRNNSFYYVPIQPQYTGFVVTTDSDDDNNGNVQKQDFRRHALFQFWSSKHAVMFIHQTKWIEPMDHALWKYTLGMNMEWECPVYEGQDHIYPLPSDDYSIQLTDSRGEDGEIITSLESKWIEFWFDFEGSPVVLS